MNSKCSVAPVTVRNVDSRYSGTAADIPERQDRLCVTLTLRRVHANIVAVVKKKVLHVSDCMFVALCIQHRVRIRHTVSCGLTGSTIFFPHCLITGRIVETTTLIFSKTFVWNISHSKKK